MEVSFVRLFLLCVFVHSSIAIRCFICDSKSNPACQDPVRSYQLQLTECTPEVVHSSSTLLARALHGVVGIPDHRLTDLLAGSIGHTYAPMQCQKIQYYVGDEKIVIRGCRAGTRWSSDSRDVCTVLDDPTRSIPGFYLNYCDTCDRDACNGGRRNIRMPSMFTFVAVLIPILFAAIL